MISLAHELFMNEHYTLTLIDKKGRNNQRTEAEQATRRAETIDGLKRNGRLVKQEQSHRRTRAKLARRESEKSRNNRLTGTERPSKKQAGRTTTVNRRERSTRNLTPPYIWIAYYSKVASRPAE